MSGRFDPVTFFGADRFNVTRRFDVVVVGGGIAGVSVAHAVAQRGRRVLLLEREAALAHHTTGRSAALFFQNYGHRDIRALSRSSRPFFDDPPSSLIDGALLRPRGALIVGFPDQTADLHAALEQTRQSADRVVIVDSDQVARLAPSLRRAIGGIYDPDAADIDVAALHQGFVRGLRSSGGEIWLSSGVDGLAADRDGWMLRCARETVRTDVVVNAAGAWADAFAEMAGLAPIGLEPRRRTAFMVTAPGGSEAWPLTSDVVMSFYFKPDGAQLLCSPADQGPSPPCDARPDEVDIALAIDRINEVTTLEIRSVRSAWAGLRTFCRDESMAIGADRNAPSFFWLAGQGGTGIQTAPAAARLAADLIVDGEVSEALHGAGVSAAQFDPSRFG